VTEAEWLAAEDPVPMLAFLRGRVDDRTLRLFACACCRLVWDLIGEAGKEAVVVAERFAEGRATNRELIAAHKLAAQSGRVVADTLPRAYAISRDEGEAAFAAVRGLEAAAGAAGGLASEAASQASVCTAHGAGQRLLEPARRPAMKVRRCTSSLKWLRGRGSTVASVR